jgi:hypothetical protein
MASCKLHIQEETTDSDVSYDALCLCCVCRVKMDCVFFLLVNLLRAKMDCSFLLVSLLCRISRGGWITGWLM